MIIDITILIIIAIADDTGLKFADAVKASKFPTVEKTVKVPNKVQNYEVAEKATKKVAENA